jgi:predicted nucleic acid-binding protein
MTPVVLDTDVVSFLFKGNRAQRYLPHLQNRQWLISFMTEAELEQWAILANWSAKKVEWLRIFLARFAVVPSSHDLVLKWAEVMASARRSGLRIETASPALRDTSGRRGSPPSR